MNDIPACATPVAHLVGPGKLGFRNRRLLYTAIDGTRLALNADRLQVVTFYGSVGLSSQAAAALVDHHVSLVWLSDRGVRLRGRFVSVDDSTILQRLRQYQLLLQPALRVTLAKKLIADRIESIGNAVRHYQRHGKPECGRLLASLAVLKKRLAGANRFAEIRGLEGAATAGWFNLFPGLLADPWSFPGRRRRPPTDPVNALLSLSAMLTTRRVTARIEAEGLEPTLGIFHQFRPGRPALACDLIEPLRAPLVERLTLRACNQHWVQPDDFEMLPGGGVHLKEKAFARFLARWEECYNEVSGPQRLGRLMAWLRRELSQIRLPTPVEGAKTPVSWADTEQQVSQEVPSI